jgi:hypothetical protein
MEGGVDVWNLVLRVLVTVAVYFKIWETIEEIADMIVYLVNVNYFEWFINIIIKWY